MIGNTYVTLDYPTDRFTNHLAMKKVDYDRLVELNITVGEFFENINDLSKINMDHETWIEKYKK